MNIGGKGMGVKELFFKKRVMGVVKRACHGKPSVNNCMIVFVLLIQDLPIYFER